MDPRVDALSSLKPFGHHPQETVRLQHSTDGWALLTLNRPEAGNSVNRAMADELSEALSAIADVQACRALLLVGEGDRFFCTGGDVKEYATLDRAELGACFLSVQQACGLLRSLPMPTIAAVDGLALGGGVELAMHCDLRVAGSAAAFRVPQVHLGIVPGWLALPRLVGAIGEARTAELLLTGRWLDAGQALDWGVVTRTGEHALTTAIELVAELPEAGGDAVGTVRRLIAHASDHAWDPASVDAANEAFLRLWFRGD